MVDSATGYGTDGFYKAKGNFIEPACKQLQNGKILEMRLKLFAKTMLKKNFLSKEQEAWIGNSVQNLNIQQEQPPSIIALLNWELLNVLDWLGQCSMMPTWMLISGPN